MRDSHITFDPRSGLFDAQPLRVFTVYQGNTGIRRADPIEVKAHMANQTENGSLVFITLKGGLAFTVHAFAAGQWVDFEGSVPSEDEVRQIKAFADREQAIMQMLEHDARTTKQ